MDYLDVTLDLESGLYQLYRKPGDRPLYVSSRSNHHPKILKNIPKGIERRLSDNSATREVFEKAAPIHQAELNRCGYTHKLEFQPRVEKPKKKKQRNPRNITWFNPPYSVNIATNIGQEFLKLLDIHFPPGHPLRSVMNRSNIKVGYRCLPNMGAKIASHNAKILRNSKEKATNKNSNPKVELVCRGET